MNEVEIKKILKQVNWDTPVPLDDLYDVFTGKSTHIGGIDKYWIYRKILNGYRWYTVLKIFPEEELPSVLSDQVINQLFPRQLRNKYLHVRNALFGEAVSAAG